jgi:protein-S-isoprenylcysteine O-methyltransferase Ste14
MTGTREVKLTDVGLVMTAHAIHLCVLLLPTLVLTGPLAMGRAAIGWEIGCFALGITAAGVLESLFLTPEVQASDTSIRDKLTLRVSLFVGICLLAVFWSAQIEWLLHSRRALAMQAMGGSLLVSGIILRVEAIRALGNQFVSDIRVERLIVRDGIYAWLRHPSEIGLLLIAIGSSLLLGSIFTAVAAAILLLPTSLWRMDRENVALAGRQRQRSNL